MKTGPGWFDQVVDETSRSSTHGRDNNIASFDGLLSHSALVQRFVGTDQGEACQIAGFQTLSSQRLRYIFSSVLYFFFYFKIPVLYDTLL